MKTSYKLLTLIMSVMMAVTYMPAMAYAAESAAPAAETEVFNAVAKAVPVKSEVKLEDSDALLFNYLETAVSEEVKDAAPVSHGKKALNARSRLNRLNNTEKKLYKELSDLIEDAATGKSDNTSFSIKLASFLDKEQYDFTLEELGVDSFVDYNGYLTDETIDSVWSKFGCVEGTVLDALLADMPYELYWYDKTAGFSIGKSYIYSIDGDTMSIYPEEDGSVLYIDFFVSPDYSADGSICSCDINTSRTKAAAAFVENTASIINANAGKDDMDKLYSYMDAICEAVDYNNAAASGTWTGGYGDPWQLIYVFDYDDSTKVVCEGYSKAFQFLCDRTEFNNKNIEAYTVTGNMDGENHMWNILRMDDGRSYLADVTNSDAESDGEAGSLFLTPAIGGSVEEGYGYDLNDDGEADASYAYDGDTLSMFSEEELTMSKKAYAGSKAYDEQFPDWNTPTYTWSSDNSSVTAEHTSKKDPSVKEAETVTATAKVTKAATCEANGETTYTSAAFENEAFEVQRKEVENIPALKHSLQKVEAAEATYDTPAFKEYWECTLCHQKFADTAGTLKIDKPEETAPSLKDQEEAAAGETISGTTADPAKELGADGTAFGKGASAEAAEKAITSQKHDKDPKGSAFAPLMLKSAGQGKTSINLTWKKVKGAKKYVIYANTCGGTKKFVRAASTTKLKYNVRKINKKSLKKSTYYKFIVVALDNKGKVVSTSKVIHAATKGKTNYTKVKVSSRVKKNKLSLKKGKTVKLAGKAVGKKVAKHKGVRYESSNSKVASVNKSGAVKGVKKGKCKIYVYAQNGICTTIKLTVK